MNDFSKETQKILKKHCGDFDCSNYVEFLKNSGGYKAYLKSLGGVFAKWAGKTASVKTVSEFHEIADYVFGLMYLYGFDYNNGKLYRKWKQEKPFYPKNKKGRSNWGKIDDICGKEKKDKTTNCNYGCDSFLYKCGLYGGEGQPTNSSAFKSHILGRKFKFTRDINSLRIGDLVHFFRDRITSDNPRNWTRWGHVAVVGDIVNGNVILFDSGGRFITTGNYQHILKVDKDNHPLNEYSCYKSFVGIHEFNLINDLKYPLKGIDISNHQGRNSMNLDIVLNLNPDINFVIVKATEGKDFVDGYCDRFFTTAKSKGRKVGFYHFARPEKNTALEEAKFFYENCKNYFHKGIPVLDWESPGKANINWALEWLNAIYKMSGVRPMIYMSESVVNAYNWGDVVQGDFGLWVAKYKLPDTGTPGVYPTVKHWDFYAIWQYTSKGKVKGYDGFIDRNIFYGTEYAWEKYCM